MASQEDLMDESKYFITSVGSNLTAVKAKRQSAKTKRDRKRIEVKNQKIAQEIAGKKGRMDKKYILEND